MFNLPAHAAVMMGAVLALLVIASISYRVLMIKHPDRDYTELKLRIRSWWWMIGLFFIVLILPPVATTLFIAFLSFMALKEFLSIVPIRSVDRRAIFWAYLAIPVQYLWVGMHWYGMFIIFIPVYLFLFLAGAMVVIGETRGFIRSVGTLHWSVMLTVFCISHLAYLVQLPTPNAAAGGIGALLFLLAMTQFNDVCQYVVGKTLGHRKIIPKTSPNKTLGGFLGGVIIITLLSGVLAPYLTALNGYEGLMAGLLIAVAGFFGDLVISAVKRDLRIKDTGRLIPGHGGILDRLDSLMFTAPLFFHYLYYLHG